MFLAQQVTCYHHKPIANNSSDCAGHVSNYRYKYPVKEDSKKSATQRYPCTCKVFFFQLVPDRKIVVNTQENFCYHQQRYNFKTSIIFRVCNAHKIFPDIEVESNSKKTKATGNDKKFHDSCVHPLCVFLG